MRTRQPSLSRFVNRGFILLICVVAFPVFALTASASPKLYDFSVFLRESENRLDRPTAPHRPVAPLRKSPIKKTIEARHSAVVATDQSRKPDYSFRPYSVVRIGPAIFTNPDESSGAELDTPAAEGLQGLALGADINRYWSLEFAAEFTETELLQPGTGEKIGEYGMWSLLGQVRLRYPMWRDRLVPYFLLGAGIGFAEMNDRNFVNAGGVSGRPAIDVNGPPRYHFRWHGRCGSGVFCQ